MHIAAWLIFGTALASDASQSVRAIPYASFDHCERHMARMLSAIDASPITIKPYCTTVEPAFWVRPSNTSSVE